MKAVLLGAVGMLVLQAFLVVGYLSVSKQDPIILNPDRGRVGRKRCHDGNVLRRRGGSGRCSRPFPRTGVGTRGRGDRR